MHIHSCLVCSDFTVLTFYGDIKREIDLRLVYYGVYILATSEVISGRAPICASVYLGFILHPRNKITVITVCALNCAGFIGTLLPSNIQVHIKTRTALCLHCWGFSSLKYLRS